MEQIKNCKFCGGNSFKYSGEQTDKNFGIPGIFSLEWCLTCGVIWTDPQLSTKEDFDKYYPKEYYAFDEIKTEDESAIVKLKLDFYDIYYHELGGNPLLRFLCLPIKFLVRGTNIYPGKKLLDIGCGNGQFLYEMKQCGMDVCGIEPAKIPKNKFDIKPDLIKTKYKDESFDLITMNHVLQHVGNPKEMIKEVHRILKKDGLFIISASNTLSLARIIFGKDWHQIDAPRHLFNLSSGRLIRFLEEHGFKVIRNRHNSRPNQFVVSLFHKFNIKTRNIALVRLLEVIFLPFTWFVNIFKIGDQVEIWCEKE